MCWSYGIPPIIPAANFWVFMAVFRAAHILGTLRTNAEVRKRYCDAFPSPLQHVSTFTSLSCLRVQHALFCIFRVPLPMSGFCVADHFGYSRWICYAFSTLKYTHTAIERNRVCGTSLVLLLPFALCRCVRFSMKPCCCSCTLLYCRYLQRVFYHKLSTAAARF